MLVHIEEVEEYSASVLPFVADLHRCSSVPGQPYSMVCFRDVTCPNCGNECVLVDYWKTPNPELPRVCSRCEEIIRDYARMDEDYYDDDEYVGPYDYDYDDDLDEFEEALGKCGMTPEGFCTEAGTEYCDFECLFRDASDEEEE